MKHEALGGHSAGFDPTCEACCKSRHPSGQADQDWHAELYRNLTQLEVEHNQKLRIQRALKMAGRCAAREDWPAYNAWQDLAAAIVGELRKA